MLSLRQNLIFRLFFIVAAATVLRPSSARALSLSEHKRVMKEAVKEFDVCHPERIGYWDNLQLWTTDVEEDLNIVRKDLIYSHFYNPFKKLNMWRYDSSDRIKGLMFSLFLHSRWYGQESKDVYSDLGHGIHHLQDMASPPHVVPVMHNLSDGFENHSDFDGDISSGMSCEQIQQQGQATELMILNETAKETLRRVAETEVPLIVINDNGEVLHLKVKASAFWNVGEGNEFGRYGLLGNHFGEADFKQGGVHYRVPASFYQSFKQAQLKLAVQASLRALSSYLLHSITN